VGSGPGGATAADELAARGRDVCILEKGNRDGRSYLHKYSSSRFATGLKLVRKGLGINPASRDIPVRTWIGVGGTSMVASANAVRGWEEDLLSHGIDIASHFDDLEKTTPVIPMPERLIGKGAQLLWKAADSLGIRMECMPKMIDVTRCQSCGNCNKQCPYNAKWTAEWAIKRAQENHAVLMQEVTAIELIVSNGKAAGVKALDRSGGQILIEADRVILAAGALATPLLLHKAGLDDAGRGLFCHPFHIVHGPLSGQSLKQEPRSVYSSHFLEKEGFTMANDVVGGELGIMIKTRDEADGRVHPSGAVQKAYTPDLLKTARTSIAAAKEILRKAGVNKRKIKVRFHAALHPGGTAAIGRLLDERMETEIKNCYVADASVLPSSTGIPPLLTIMALARHLGKNLD
jgi:choline dehydrogenase-like flavoprotein